RGEKLRIPCARGATVTLRPDDAARRTAPPRALRVAVTGASGMIGSAVVDSLRGRGHEVRPFVRGHAAATGEIGWDPVAGRIDGDELEGIDAVVNLAGAGLADARWTAARKAVLASSRAGATALLAETLASLATKPRVLVSASAVGFYGDRGDERIDESSPAG